MVKSVQTSYIYLFLLQENITVEMGPQFCYCAYFSNEKVGTEASYFGSFFFLSHVHKITVQLYKTKKEVPIVDFVQSLLVLFMVITREDLVTKSKLKHTQDTKMLDQNTRDATITRKLR